MQPIPSQPTIAERSPADHSAARAAVDSSSRADIALAVAILGPLAMIGLMMLIGVGIAVALCATFVFVFSMTTMMDVVRFLRRRRVRNDRRRFGV